MDWNAFFKVHKDLPREGPGSVDDVLWACELAQVSPEAMICDVGCGPGGDVMALLQAAPEAQVLAMDKHAGFVDTCAKRFAGDLRVQAQTGDMADLPAHPEAPFDLIWCAGALYFLGLDRGLDIMKRALKPGGTLCFSEPAYFTDAPSARATEFWEGHPTQTDTAVSEAVTRAGFNVLGQRRVSDAGWQAYYQPMLARIGQLRAGADAALTAMLDLCAGEAQHWQEVRQDTGYTLIVAQVPV
ncbi:MAG: methyltransferase domain-containing protein [Pelagimonas sp.]|jgi:trans-aconitate methyltransferase|nr:methyltransferase domain-containing protein [Pelagimonas sp.]